MVTAFISIALMVAVLRKVSWICAFVACIYIPYPPRVSRIRNSACIPDNRIKILPAPSSLPLKVSARTHQRYTLIHNRLADPKVVLDPALEVRRFGEGFGADARTAVLVGGSG